MSYYSLTMPLRTEEGNSMKSKYKYEFFGAWIPRNVSSVIFGIGAHMRYDFGSGPYRPGRIQQRIIVFCGMCCKAAAQPTAKRGTPVQWFIKLPCLIKLFLCEIFEDRNLIK